MWIRDLHPDILPLAVLAATSKRSIDHVSSARMPRRLQESGFTNTGGQRGCLLLNYGRCIAICDISRWTSLTCTKLFCIPHCFSLDMESDVTYWLRPAVRKLPKLISISPQSEYEHDSHYRKTWTTWQQENDHWLQDLQEKKSQMRRGPSQLSEVFEGTS